MQPYFGISIADTAKPKATKSKKREKKPAKKADKATTSAASLTVDAPNAGTAAKKKPVHAKPISILDAAEKVLDKEGAPLHAEILAQRINETYDKTTNAKSLAASLPDDSTQRFEKVGGNTWALFAWPEEKKKPRPVAVSATA